MPRSTEPYRIRLIREALTLRAKLDEALDQLDNLVADAPDLDAIVTQVAENISSPGEVSDEHIAAVEAAIAQQEADAASRTLHALHALSNLTLHTGGEAPALPPADEPPAPTPILPSGIGFTAIIGPNSLTLLTNTGAVPITEQGRGMADAIRRGIADALRAEGYTPVGVFIDQPEDGRQWFIVGTERKPMGDDEAIQLLQLTRLRGSQITTDEYALPNGGFNFGRDLPSGDQATTIPLSLNGVEVVVSQRTVEDAISYLLAIYASPSERTADFLYSGLVPSFHRWFGEQAEAVINAARAEGEEQEGDEGDEGDDKAAVDDKMFAAYLDARQIALQLGVLGYSFDIQRLDNGHHILIVNGIYPMSADEARSLIQATEQRGEPLEIRDCAEHYGRGRGGDDERFGWSYDFSQATE